MNALIVILSWFSIALSQKFTLDTQFPLGRNGDQLTNLLVKDNRIYLAENGMVNILNKDLTHIGNFSTCDGDDCDNINKVLASYDDLLVLCGTGNGGICQTWNGSHFVYNSSSDLGKKSNYLVISSDVSIPAVGLVVDEHLLLGVTYGEDIPEDEISGSKTYRYLLSKSMLSDSFITEGSVHLKNNIYQNYKVYFRHVFENESFVYFLTNQRPDLSSQIYISKVIRICVNVTNKVMSSYADLILSCEIGGIKYNLVEDAVFLPANGYLVAAFSKGDDPHSTEQNGAICVYTLESINNGIRDAKKDFITCKDRVNTNDSQFYLKTGLASCVNETIYQRAEENYICPTEEFGPKVISSNKVSPIIAFRVENTDGRITKIGGVERYEQYPDIVYGTDRGSFSRFAIDGNNTIHQLESTVSVDNHPVADMYIPEYEDKLYILTSRKMFKLSSSKCSSFKSYLQTLDGKNPSCGWCITTSLSTKKDDCPTDWISSLSSPVSIDVRPKYLLAQHGIGIAVLNVSLRNVPPSLKGNLRCKYEAEQIQFGAPVPAVEKSNNSFTCDISYRDEHTNVTVQLKSGDTIYAETVIQMYNCSSYKTCDKCRESSEIDCQWCSKSLTCLNSSLDCPNSEFVKGNSSQCPKISESQSFYIPAGINKTITLNGKKFVESISHKCIVTLNETSEKEFLAVVNKSSVTCEIKANYDEDTAKKLFPIKVLQITDTTNIQIAQEKQIYVTVYKCQKLAGDCTLCGGLNKSRYDCSWCDSRCDRNSVCIEADPCPQPQITEVFPASGGYKGGTELTISFRDLGKKAVDEVTVGGLMCENIRNSSTNDPDFEDVNIGIICKLEQQDDISRIGQQNISVKIGQSFATGFYMFKNPRITNITPVFGVLNGGTRITLSGQDLDVGGKLDFIRLGNLPFCENTAFLYPDYLCTTPAVTKKTRIDNVKIKIDSQIYQSNDIIFDFEDNPTITIVTTSSGEDMLKSIVSGGMTLTMKGTNFEYVGRPFISAEYGGDRQEGACHLESNTILMCLAPPAPKPAREEIEEYVSDGRKRRSIPDGNVKVTITIELDGYKESRNIYYVRDPVFDKFQEEDTTRIYRSNNKELLLQGNYLTLAATKDDFKVYLGLSAECRVITVTETNLTCQPTVGKFNHDQTTNVTVFLGNYHQSIGFVKFIHVIDDGIRDILKTVLPIIAGVVFLVIVGFIFFGIKYRRVKGKAVRFEKNLANMELQIKKVFREEFLDMHTTMSRVNESLIEKGFPYNNYQRYCFLMMFPGEWNMEEHPLMHEPVVSDHIRGKLKQGMDQFDELLKNKFFLVSIVSTMEKQKKFFLKEKSNMAGHLSVALLGKMEYVHEILIILLTNLVDDTQAKSQKTLFRRCESITEKLLSNWLVLSLYPHVKLHSGSPLYMLLKGTQLTMESGPIDALTGDSKYTLSEDKLLRQDDKPNTLTLKIMVDNSDEIRDCKVLDCDTISQVKAKCLSQIYVNYPASQLTVESSDLNLEWHWGTGGRLMIQDEDTTSKREGQWLRLNTLDHYKVTDGSSMALVDPHGLEQEDYVNLANIRIDTVDPGCNGSVHSNDPLTPPDEESGLIERWHLVKPDSDQQKPESFVVEELYLNRLITTKQSVLEYMKNLFDTILSSTVPPPTKFLFDFLDELGEKNKVESDTLHAWKSQCYTIRFWATLINKPYNLFDQRIPSYVETSMEVIGQVLIESCSLKAPEYTKDSSPGKLIFKKDMVDYRDKVKQYYTQVKTVNQDSEDLRLYLKDLNKFQQQQLSFNRQAALYSLYAQLQPYMDEIMEDLESNEETKSLHLDRKLATLNNFMQED